MNKTSFARFLIEGSAHHPSMPSSTLQKALGTKIGIDRDLHILYVPTSEGTKAAGKGDTIICYSDGTYDVERKKL